MPEFKVINISVFLILMLQSTGAPPSHSSLSVGVGNEVTLPCKNAKDFHDSCYSTTWIFSGSGSSIALTLFEYGKIHNDARAKSHRLSVTANCSLVMKNVTSQDGGLYSCRQFRLGQVTDSYVDLFISTAGNPVSNFNFAVRPEVLPGPSGGPMTSATKLSTRSITESTTTTNITKSPTATIIIKSITTITMNKSPPTMTTIKSNITTTTTITATETTKVKSNTTAITTKTPTTTTTIKSTTTTTTTWPMANSTIQSSPTHSEPPIIKSTTNSNPTGSEPAPENKECINTVQFRTLVITVACGFAVLVIIVAVIGWKAIKLNQMQPNDNIELNVNRSSRPGTSQGRAQPADVVSYCSNSLTKKPTNNPLPHSKHSEGAAANDRTVRVSFTSCGDSDASSIYATMKRI